VNPLRYHEQAQRSISSPACSAWVTLGARPSLGQLLNAAEGWLSEASWLSERHEHVCVLFPRQKSSVQLGSGEGSLTLNKHSKVRTYYISSSRWFIRT